MDNYYRPRSYNAPHVSRSSKSARFSSKVISQRFSTASGEIQFRDSNLRKSHYSSVFSTTSVILNGYQKFATETCGEQGRWYWFKHCITMKGAIFLFIIIIAALISGNYSLQSLIIINFDRCS